MKQRRHFPAPFVPAFELLLADRVQEPHSDSGPLPFGTHDEATRVHTADVESRGNSQMAHKLTVDRSDVPTGANHPRQLQIMMRLEGRPETPVGFVNFQF